MAECALQYSKGTSEHITHTVNVMAVPDLPIAGEMPQVFEILQADGRAEVGAKTMSYTGQLLRRPDLYRPSQDPANSM